MPDHALEIIAVVAAVEMKKCFPFGPVLQNKMSHSGIFQGLRTGNILSNMRWCIAHSDPEIMNEPGKAQNVVIREEKAQVINNALVSPPYSIVIYRLGLK